MQSQRNLVIFQMQNCKKPQEHKSVRYQSTRLFKFIVGPYQGFSRETWRLLAAGFINSMALIIVIYISLYLNSHGYNVKKIGIVLSVFGFCGIGGAYFN